MLLRIDNVKPGKPENGVYDILADRMKTAADRFLSSRKIHSVSFSDANTVCCVIGAHDTESVRPVLRDCFSEIKTVMYSHGDYLVTMSVGIEVDDIHKLHMSYLDADIAVKYRPIAGLNRMIESDKLNITHAKWMATCPGIVIADEPVNGLDIASKTEVMSLL